MAITLNKHQALALNAVLRYTADVRYHLVTVEADVESIRAGLDSDTNILSLPIHSVVSLRIATDGLKFAEHEAREHLSSESVEEVERIITAARRRALNSSFATKRFATGEAV